MIRKEFGAIVKCFKCFYKYLYGQYFMLRTGHTALKWLLNFKNPKEQIAWWIERIQTNLNALSMRPCDENCNYYI